MGAVLSENARKISGSGVSSDKFPVYVTGNPHKAAYFARLIGREIEHHDIDIAEIQSGSLDEVVEHKVRSAYETLQRPVIVEDTALGFSALHGLPGPFIKFFVSLPNGDELLCRMCDGLSSRKATASTTFAYFDGETVRLFHGSHSGEIADHPRGKNGFCWDTIFVADGQEGLTRAELDQVHYDELYLKIKPIAQVSEFLATLST